MSKFSLSSTETFQFDGDTVTVKLKPLSRSAMMSLAPYVGDGTPETMDNQKLFDHGAEHIESHIESMKGLTDSAGTEITISTMVDNAYFLPLMSEIMAKLFDLATVSEDDVKNSNGRHSTSTEEQVTSEAR